MNSVRELRHVDFGTIMTSLSGTSGPSSVSNYQASRSCPSAEHRIEVNYLSIFYARKRSVSPPPSINVTPLIDVLLVLLIIFMVIQPHKEAKLPVKAPEAAPGDVPPSPETLMLTIAGDMRLTLNSKHVELDELLPSLSELMEQRSVESRTLFIKAPAGLPYGPVVLLVDLAKGSGVITVGLIQDQT
jgi:biopolymer transport protein TolR